MDRRGQCLDGFYSLEHFRVEVLVDLEGSLGHAEGRLGLLGVLGRSRLLHYQLLLVVGRSLHPRGASCAGAGCE